jgi:Response regulator containing CheY-like receiver, AAA-type ATPase, and DNA-binding domains
METPKRVIVVDDNEILLRAWKKILDKAGCEAMVTTNPQEALDLMEATGADLIISDIVMPQIDGFELLQRIQHLPLTQQPRIILTTGYVCDFKRLSLDLGHQEIHVLLKPYNSIQEVSHFIQRLLEDDETLNDEESSLNLEDSRIHLWSL